MSSIYTKLAPKHRKALALFYGTSAYDALLALNKLVKANAASKSLEAVDFLQVKHLQGQKHAVERQEEELKQIYKSDQKS